MQYEGSPSAFEEGNIAMNILKKAMTSAAAMSLAVMPVAAHAADASKLSLAGQARAAKTVDNDNDLAAGGGVIVAILAAAAVVVGIVIVADSEDDPESP